eukprot:scaffold29448_cov31-Tisochrysis_lutea.AAC.1
MPQAKRRHAKEEVFRAGLPHLSLVCADLRDPAPAVHGATPEGISHETGMKTWDPLGLADLGSPATLAFFRHAELKHCRVRAHGFTAVAWQPLLL